MEKEALKRIFNFLKDKEQQNAPLMWKLFNNEPFIEEDLNVKGNLYLAYSDITSLPEGLKVGGDLNLSGCKSLDSLPEGLEVGEILDLDNTNITSLPEGLKVGGTLFLSKTNITSLPKGLEVGWWLHISNSPLTKHSDDELREMIKPGFIEGGIYRK